MVVRTAFRRSAHARLYLFHGDKVFLKGDDPLFTVAEADAFGAQRVEAILLGWAEGGPRLAVVIPEAIAIAEGQVLARSTSAPLPSRRSVAGEQIGALAQARSLSQLAPPPSLLLRLRRAEHDEDRRLSPRLPGLRRRRHFPRTDPVVVMLAIEGDRCLLGRHGAVSACRCIPASPVSSSRARRSRMPSAARRPRRPKSASGAYAITRAEPWPFPSSLMIGCQCRARSPRTSSATRPSSRIAGGSRARKCAAMLADTHPDGLKTPPAMAIAHRLIRAPGRRPCGALPPRPLDCRHGGGPTDDASTSIA